MIKIVGDEVSTDSFRTTEQRLTQSTAGPPVSADCRSITGSEEQQWKSESFSRQRSDSLSLQVHTKGITDECLSNPDSGAPLHTYWLMTKDVHKTPHKTCHFSFCTNETNKMWGVNGSFIVLYHRMFLLLRHFPHHHVISWFVVWITLTTQIDIYEAKIVQKDVGVWFLWQ